MKKITLIFGLYSALFFVSCEKKTTTTVNQDGETTTVEKVGFDKEKIDSAAEKVESGVKDAAKKTEAALENAGEKLKKSAKEAKHDFKNATDGDGNPKK